MIIIGDEFEKVLEAYSKKFPGFDFRVDFDPLESHFTITVTDLEFDKKITQDVRIAKIMYGPIDWVIEFYISDMLERLKYSNKLEKENGAKLVGIDLKDAEGGGIIAKSAIEVSDFV